MLHTRMAAIVATALAVGPLSADDPPPHVPVTPPGTIFKPDDVLKAIGAGGQSAQAGVDPKAAEGLSDLAKSLGGWLKDHPELANSMAKPMMEMLAKNPDLLKAQPPEGVQKLMEDFAKSDAGKGLAADPEFQRQLNESGLKEKMESLWPLMKNQMGEGNGEGRVEGGNAGIGGSVGGEGGVDRERLMKLVESLSGGDRSNQKQNHSGGAEKQSGTDGSGSEKGSSLGAEASKWMEGIRKNFGGGEGASKGEGGKAAGEEGSRSGSGSGGNFGNGLNGGRQGTGGASGTGGGEGASKSASETTENARKLSEMVRRAMGEKSAADSLKSALEGIGNSVNAKPPTPTFGERLLPTKQMFGGLGDNIGAAANWASRTGKFVGDALGSIPRPTLPSAMSAPRFTPPSLAGLGSMFSAPSADAGKGLGVFLAVAAVIALGVWMLWRSPTESIRAAIARTFRRPLNLSGLTERERVARLFEHAAVSEIGESVLPRHHRQAAQELARIKSGEVEAAEELAQLYEAARYSPPQEPIAANAGATAYGLLFRLNAAPKVVGEPASAAP